MAAKHEGVPSATRQSLLAGGVIHFALEDGHTGVIAPEERRTYDYIIHSNSRNTALIGLTGQQYCRQFMIFYKTDSSKSRCPSQTHPVKI